VDETSREYKLPEVVELASTTSSSSSSSSWPNGEAVRQLSFSWETGAISWV
jgi:hypothetical protein